MATLHTRSLDLDGRISAYPLGNTIHSVSYDPASRVTGISGAETQSYGYDALDRLTSVTAPGITQTYSYDPNGNRLSDTLGSQTTTYNYGLASNRLQSRTQGTTQPYTSIPPATSSPTGRTPTPMTPAAGWSSRRPGRSPPATATMASASA